MPQKKDELNYVTYCGLHCGLCASVCRIPKRAEALRASLAKEGYNEWGMDMPGFKPFWEYLVELGGGDKACPGCRKGGGNPACTIRSCAREKEMEFCVDCDEYPCEKVKPVSDAYPTVVSDAMRMKKIGIDKWIKEQEARAKTGFAYCDIRCYPSDVKDV